MKNECPLRRKIKKRAMKATWDDESESESDEESQEEVANMCFMAIDDEVTSLDYDDLLDDECDEKPSYDELLDDFNDLHMRFEKLALKNNALKKKVLNLSKELDEALKIKEVTLSCKNCDSFKMENASLQEKVLDLTKTLHKFANGKKYFDMMLGQKKCFFDKSGIGYKGFIKAKYLKNYFVKASSQSDSNLVCTFCNQNGHTTSYCTIKKNAKIGVKQVWVPKVPKTNTQGPKVMWVPKVNA